jgi:hypothetical protein
MIHHLHTEYPIRMLCDVLACPQRSYYSQPVPVDETALHTAIEQIVIRRPYYGYRRVTAQLRREGWTVNRTSGAALAARGWLACTDRTCPVAYH